ncbi:hypothetical protein OEA41_007731 [Lepraria neglecta]|uniref:Uncharacterized protein n=1 Tax=Lepraria neglecta TaxID=209136 RepID=A0AAD9ZEF0_9LECA|nr:hypothetical protein OEA41_007731 [Lepraria neglecta]
MHQHTSTKHPRPEDEISESSNKRIRRVGTITASPYGHNWVEDRQKVPHSSIEDAQQLGAPKHLPFHDQSDLVFFQQYATVPTTDYHRARRLPTPTPLGQASQLPQLTYRPPPWNSLEHASTQQVLQNAQPPADHIFTREIPNGMELAPFDTAEQRYWREQKGRSKLPVMEPNGLVALNQNSSIDSDILSGFSSVSDIGKP